MKIISSKLYWLWILGIVCLLVGLSGFFILARPALAFTPYRFNQPAPTQENRWARMYVPKPTFIPVNQQMTTSRDQDIMEAILTGEATPAATVTQMPEATETLGTMIMKIVDDGSSNPFDQTPAQFSVDATNERWVDVNLSEQRVYAYEGSVIVNSFLVSTGLPDTPTVTGQYTIYIKVPIQDMSGPGYYLPNVPWVMYFYESYGFHGTYWHNNFGKPMSRGCVNMRIEDAKWLFDWASVGTAVNVHY